MKRLAAAVLLCLAGLLALSRLAVAQTAPPKEISLLSVSRIAIAAGASYDWHNGPALNPQPTFEKEFAAGLYGAYVLTEHVSGFAAAVWGVDNKTLRFSPGAHYRFHVGSEFFAFAMTYDFYTGESDEVPRYPHEWAGSATYARAIGKNLIIGGAESYSLDNREFRTSVGIRVPLWLGRDS